MANHRPEAIAQRAFADLLPANPRQTDHGKTIDAIHSSPRVVAQRGPLGGRGRPKAPKQSGEEAPGRMQAGPPIESGAGPAARAAEVGREESPTPGSVHRTVDAPLPSRGPAIQRWLNPQPLAHVTDSRIRGLAAQANAYNSHRRGKNRTARINELHALQVATMKWLDGYSVPDQNRSRAAIWTKNLLNDIQREHGELVAASIQHADAQPPVANFDQLSNEDQATVTRLWTHLVAGTGNVQITEDESYTHSATQEPTTRSHPGFRTEVLAQFARLLETATGRTIVKQVSANTGGRRLVTIKPGFARAQEGGPAREFAASPDAMDGADKLTRVDVVAKFKGQKDAKKRRDQYIRRFIPLDLDAIADPKRKAASIYEARRANPGAAGVTFAGEYYAFGRGTAASVTVTRDVRDAEENFMSRFVDEKLNEIPTPNFITLGHELGHAAHMIAGTALGDAPESLFPGDPSEAMRDWSDVEEYANINSVENALRADYGMKERYGHINQSVVQKRWLEPVVDQFYSLTRWLPAQQKQAVEEPLNGTIARMGALDIPGTRQALRNANEALTAELDAIPGLTNSQRKNLRKQLATLDQLLDSPHAQQLESAAKSLGEMAATIRSAQPAPPQRTGGGGWFSWLWG